MIYHSDFLLQSSPEGWYLEYHVYHFPGFTNANINSPMKISIARYMKFLKVENKRAYVLDDDGEINNFYELPDIPFKDRIGRTEYFLLSQEEIDKHIIMEYI